MYQSTEPCIKYLLFFSPTTMVAFSLLFSPDFILTIFRRMYFRLSHLILPYESFFYFYFFKGTLLKELTSVVSTRNR